MNFDRNNVIYHHHGSGPGSGNGFLITLEDCEGAYISVNLDNLPAGKDVLDVVVTLLEALKNLPLRLKDAGNTLYLFENEAFIKVEGAKYPPALDQREPTTICPN